MNLVYFLCKENVALRKKLEAAYFSTNFNCWNRAGAESKGRDCLIERRRQKSGCLAVIAFDIAGMGIGNSTWGELEVNRRVTQALQAIKGLRQVFFLSQLNYGDEFALIVDEVDVKPLMKLIDNIFRQAGFSGAYVGYRPASSLSLDFIELANEAMTDVYLQKSMHKTKST